MKTLIEWMKSKDHAILLFQHLYGYGFTEEEGASFDDVRWNCFPEEVDPTKEELRAMLETVIDLDCTVSGEVACVALDCLRGDWLRVPEHFIGLMK